MSEVPATTPAAAPESGVTHLAASVSALSSEHSAIPTGAAETPRSKPRSCVTCRTRKVRCDKGSPCSNCRRAKIPCIVPSLDKPPRWARRLERVANNARAEQEAHRGEHGADMGVSQVMERLRSLEGLVKDLTSELEQARAANITSGGNSSTSAHSPSSNQELNRDHTAGSSPAPDASNVHEEFGRLVIGDSSRSRYVTGGFWSRIHDELAYLKTEAEGLAGEASDSAESETSLGEALSTRKSDQTTPERYAYLFRHSMGSSKLDLREFYPSSYQSAFLLYVFTENVNLMLQVVHMPTVNKMVKNLPGNDLSSLKFADQALMFAIYYAAVISMEEDDIMANFGSTQAELSLKYRIGLEHALAKADFLSVPNLVTLQAFVIFVLLLRRRDSPRFVWMMTGLAIRMAHSLGLHHDGSRFPHLTPYEIEMRRRLWWGLCMLDTRTAEDQDTDLTITPDSFDTRVPLNINNTDIDPETKETPMEREGVSDMTFALEYCYFCDVTRQMMATSLKGGAPSLDEKIRILDEFRSRMENSYVYKSSESTNIYAFWTEVTIARLFVSKMTLITYIAHLPTLFSSASETYSDEIRARLFVSAIEVAEYNHALNDEHACRQWRWVYQTYTHWHTIVYLLLAITRRPWSPVVERAWVDLHSTWLIPTQSKIDKSLPIWVPLRKLMAKARAHRDAELERLCSDPRDALRLEDEDRRALQPASPGPFPGPDNAEVFRERWRRLLKLPPRQQEGMQTDTQSTGGGAAPSGILSHSNVIRGIQPVQNRPFVPPGGSISASDVPDLDPGLISDAHSQGIPTDTFYSPFASAPTPSTGSAAPADWGLGTGFGTWLWADADPSTDLFANVNFDVGDLSMDIDSGIDWNNWVNSAKGAEMSGGTQSGSQP
ncbi:fungal-specific transcription factor domain-containing protein [Hypoxylon sp. FL1284]|nr:fungal-specific transcription factor domain-containing protein [Hypoxylon sp. FL1284]